MKLDNEQKKLGALNQNDNEGLKQGTGGNNQLTKETNWCQKQRKD